MTRLIGRVLNVEHRDGVAKDGKPYYAVSLLVLDEDNEVSMVRIFDRDGKLRQQVKSVKVGEPVTLRIEKFERLPNRTYDAFGFL